MINDIFVTMCWQIYTNAWFAWQGQTAEHICSTLTKVDPQVWVGMNSECQIIIVRHFMSFYIPFRNLLLIVILLWQIRNACQYIFCIAVNHVRCDYKKIR